MTGHDTQGASPPVLTIADVRFTWDGGLDAARLSPSFRPFLEHVSDADLDCRVTIEGADAALAHLPLLPDQTWTFHGGPSHCELIRRNAAGEPLWRLAGPLAFERATVSWNPLRFLDHFGSLERAVGLGLGLSLLVLRLRAHGGLLLHGMAAAWDGIGMLGVGVSGQGKSTLARLLHDAGAAVLTDERPILRQVRPGAARPSAAASPAAFRVYGSPWPSSGGVFRNAHAPLRHVYLLEHGSANRITPLPPREALRRLIPVLAIPLQNPALLDACLQTLEALLSAVPCSVFAFRPEPGAAECLRDHLRASGKGAPA